MRLFFQDKTKLKITTNKSEGFSGWLKCSRCQEMLHEKENREHLNCCPKCGHHEPLGVRERIASLVDPDSFQEQSHSLRSQDPLQFVDSEPYRDRLKRAMRKTGSSEAVVTGICTLEGRSVALGVLNFAFMAGSMGSVVGERLTRLIETALEKRLPLIIVSASGGARMQESVLSLMQMAKTSAALARLHEARLAFISVLTHPTSGGVTASFASLGDIILAEPDALICFAGPRVVQQVMRQKLPPGAQRAEFLYEHGLIDGVVKRKDLRNKLVQLLQFLAF